MAEQDSRIPFTAEQRVWLQETFAANIIRKFHGGLSGVATPPDNTPAQDYGSALPLHHTPEQPVATSGSGEWYDRHTPPGRCGNKANSQNVLHVKHVPHGTMPPTMPAAAS